MYLFYHIIISILSILCILSNLSIVSILSILSILPNLPNLCNLSNLSNLSWEKHGVLHFFYLFDLVSDSFSSLFFFVSSSSSASSSPAHSFSSLPPSSAALSVHIVGSLASKLSKLLSINGELSIATLGYRRVCKVQNLRAAQR
jgi:hypothetical protein